MPEKKYFYLPETKTILGGAGESPSEKDAAAPVKADTPCPCCGHITIPNGGDALAFICPVCLWEIDLFIRGEEETSDQNHGLTLRQARENYKAFGAVQPELVKHARQPCNII